MHPEEVERNGVADGSVDDDTHNISPINGMCGMGYQKLCYHDVMLPEYNLRTLITMSIVMSVLKLYVLLYLKLLMFKVQCVLLCINLKSSTGISMPSNIVHMYWLIMFK